jgi:hypothetical protein
LNSFGSSGSARAEMFNPQLPGHADPLNPPAHNDKYLGLTPSFAKHSGLSAVVKLKHGDLHLFH